MTYLASPIGLQNALLAVSALGFLWLALAPPSLPIPWRGRRDAPATPFPPDRLDAWPRPDIDGGTDARERVVRILDDQLRHPARGGDFRDLTPAMLKAVLILGAAVARHDRIDDAIMALMSRALMDPGLPHEGGIPDRDVLIAVEESCVRHAWWDSVAVDLMERARASGSWVTPHDLRFLSREEPALLAALSAGPGGTVSPDGAGVLAHHMAERVARAALAAPCTGGAVGYLFPRLAESDRL